MSGTTKTAEATKPSSENAIRAAYRAAAQNGAAHAKEGVHTVSEAVAEAVDTTSVLSSQVMEETREAMMTGVRNAADVGGRVADISFDRGRHLLASTVHTMDIYRDASERSAERVQSLFSSWMALSRGMQQMQHAWLESFDHAMDHAAHKPQDLLRCKTMVEVAEVQRDLYIDAVDQIVTSSSRLLEMIDQTARNAIHPLQNRSS